MLKRNYIYNICILGSAIKSLTICFPDCMGFRSYSVTWRERLIDQSLSTRSLRRKVRRRFKLSILIG